MEQSFRRIAVGRKNWLFCMTPKGAHALMACYSVVVTLRHYVKDDLMRVVEDLLRRLPLCNSRQDFADLLPEPLRGAVLQGLNSRQGT